ASAPARCSRISSASSSTTSRAVLRRPTAIRCRAARASDLPFPCGDSITSVAEIYQTMEHGPAPESDAEARAWLKQHGAKFGHFVNGAWTKPGTTFDVIDPSTTDTLAKVTQGSGKDVDAAVAAARKAQRSWGKLSGHQRAKH